MRLTGNNGVVRNHCWLIELLLAAFVGALKLVAGSVRVEKAHSALSLRINGVVIFNKLIRETL